MRVIIAGSRSFKDYELLKRAVAESGFEIDCVISGRALGADTLGERWAAENKVPVERHPADWNFYGRKAGILRNHAMARVADGLIAVWDGISPGTDDMIKYARALGLKVHVQMFALPPGKEAQ